VPIGFVPGGSAWISDQYLAYFDIPRDQLLEKNSGHRKLVIYLLKGHTALANRQIGQMFGGLTYSAVSKTYQRFSAKLRDDRRLQRKVKEVMSHVKT